MPDVPLCMVTVDVVVAAALDGDGPGDNRKPRAQQTTREADVPLKKKYIYIHVISIQDKNLSL